MSQVLLSGLAIGSIYGLVAMAFAVVFYVTRVINFATGQLLMVSIMITAALSDAKWPIYLAILIGVGASVLFGIVIYFIAIRPVLRYDRFSFAWLVSSLGVAIVIQSGAAIIWGPTSKGFPRLLYGHSVNIGHASLTWQEILTIGIALFVLIGFEVFRKKTLFGKLSMAISYDPEMASVMGANVTRFAILAFGIGGLFAGVAGVLIGPITYANPYLGDTYGIAGFVALMIGGIEKPAAAMGGGLVLGILSIGANTYINSQASDWFPFLVVVIVLLLAPKGVFASGDLFKSFFKRRFLKVDGSTV
ncbi:MAG TPA: branched-chain amino acid ABC transporter permease [Candidatus Nanopelagicaceae bacterium]